TKQSVWQMMEGLGTTEAKRHREAHGILCRKDLKAQRNTKRGKEIHSLTAGNIAVFFFS
ncbi:hypothetical protein SAMN02745131_04197, partial [Flavisolibacter ginsengisoli DSM 18119]